MREIDVYYNDRLAGRLCEHSTADYSFRYADEYLSDDCMPSIAVSLPKSQKEFHSLSVFPFFTNMLPEGANLRIICRRYKVDENDLFGILMLMRGSDFIGAVNLR